MVHVPNLRKQSSVGIYHSLDVFFEGANDHRVGHGKREGKMGCHLCGYVFGSIIEDEARSTRMMFSEGGDIKNIGIEYDKNLLILCGIVL